MAILATQTVALAGLAPTFSAASAGGDKVECNERGWLEVKNGGGSSITVTVTSTFVQEGLPLSNLVVTVPASGERRIGPLQPRSFRNDTDGLAAISYSGTTSVTVASLRI